MKCYFQEEWSKKSNLGDSVLSMLFVDVDRPIAVIVIAGLLILGVQVCD